MLPFGSINPSPHTRNGNTDGYEPGAYDYDVFCTVQSIHLCKGQVTRHAVLRLSGGRKLPITANAAPEDMYISSVRVNGKDWNSAILPHNEIASGGTLEFVLNDKPTQWTLNTITASLP